MKVILLQDVQKLGVRGSVCDVNEGYFRNHLQKNNLAKVFDQSTLNQLKRVSEHQSKIREHKKKRTNILLDKIHRISVRIRKKANDDGTLYSAVVPHDIVVAYGDKGIKLREDSIQLKSPIKKTGLLHEEIIYKGKSVKISIEVKSD